ncbi:MAG: hypothetical protein JWN95_1892 [Frankiales bacterium]|nr:hypothetical protein [Frankiales bacterium]
MLVLVSLLICLPVPLTAGSWSARLLAVIATLTLAASCLWGYRIKRAPLFLDPVDAIAIAGFALACTDPQTALAIAFGFGWFRSLYGSTWRAVTRCGLYAVGIGLSLPLWLLIPGHAVTPAVAPLVGIFPFMFVTVIVSRQLGTGLMTRAQALRRDAVLTATGAELLGLTDLAAIQTLAWRAASEICLTSPGLRLLKVIPDHGVLQVAGADGTFASVPATLPAIAVSVRPDGSHHIADDAALDAAVGATLRWHCVAIPDQSRAFMALGAPKRVPDGVLLAVQSLANQVALARRNSDVHEELTVQARIDSLTGLANRAAFTSELASQIDHGSSGTTLHVLFLDLDDFKNVNDILGHRVGDDVLGEVARRLNSASRPEDTCARLGGDEFAVLLRGVSDDTAKRIAQRMVDAIAEPVQLGDHTVRIGASIGIAGTVADAYVDLDALVHQADVAMYAAKACGKGRVEIFQNGLLNETASRVTFERELSAAAAAGELIVHYQPILSLTDKRCTAVEALVRWQHPERGLLPPADFIDIAERTGAIIDVGEFVLRQACSDAAGWRASNPGSPLAVHVNVSATQLDRGDFVRTVTDCLRESGIPPHALVLELTETVVLNSTEAIARLKLLASHGVQIGIDDFGTGYSSLTTLRSLPINVLKLDRTFVAGVLDNPIDRAVISAIVRVSTELGLYTVAEGIERPEQAQFLDAIGTDAVQGYLYQRPVPAAQFESWYADNLSASPVTEASVIPLRKPRRTG